MVTLEGQAYKVLLVEDHDQVRKLIKTVLERDGFEVIVACDGHEGMRLQRENPADVVITDIIMPNKEGFETITELRSEFPDTKIIAISGGGRNQPDRYLKFAETFGADYTFQKPLDMNQLIEKLRELLAKSETSQ